MSAIKQHNSILIHPDIMSGVPVFKGTRVPIKALWDYLKAGESLDTFLEDYPSVQRTQAIQVLDQAQEELLDA